MLNLRSTWCRVVHNVRRVDSKLNTLGLADAECLADVCIQRVVPNIPERVLTQSSSLSRKRILQNDHARTGPGL